LETLGKMKTFKKTQRFEQKRCRTWSKNAYHYSQMAVCSCPAFIHITE
jgi:hypothetical protein